MRCGVIETDKIVAETAGHHVEVNPPLIKKTQRSNHLRDRIGMHVHRLNRNQRAEPLVR
jgi:hypothetical protein